MSKKIYLCVYEGNASSPENSVAQAFESLKEDCAAEFDECTFYEASEVKVIQEIKLVETITIKSKGASCV